METEDTEVQSTEEAKPVKTERKRSKVRSSAPSKPARVIYIGPTILREGLVQFQVFKDGKPSTVESIAKTAPQVHQLFVPVEKLAQARAALSRSGSREQRMFNAVKSAFSRT